MQTIKIILSILNWLVIGCIVLLAIYFIAPRVSNVIGYQSFVVQSGSMEPSILTGDIIISELKSSNKPFKIKDIITYNSNSDGNSRIVTHRIIELGQENNQHYYKTKGDSNKTEDSEKIMHDQVIGKVIAIIPKLGYMVSFAKTIPGLVILLLLPTIIYIIDELIRVRNARH